MARGKAAIAVGVAVAAVGPVVLALSLVAAAALELSLGNGRGGERANGRFISVFDFKSNTYVFDKEGEHGNLHYRQATKENSHKKYIYT